MEHIMAYLHNYFYKFKESGDFSIEFNSISRQGNELRGKYVVGQYVRIIGSAVNDGVYKVLAVQEDEIPGITLDACLSDESFRGVICSLGVPKAFIELSDEIKAYNEANSNKGDLVSESFGGYSYTRATINGELATWKDVYKTSLAPYRKMTDGLKYVREVK